MSFDLWITSNSPGEVSNWVAGVVPRIKALRPEWRIRLALVPCPFASGAEQRVAAAIEGLDEVLSPPQTVSWLLGQHRLAWPKAPQGRVLFLGGDPWHALLLKWRLGYRLLGYFERRSWWTRWFERVAYAYGAGALGNLMVDRVRACRQSTPLRVGLFPGSRAWQLRLTLGGYLALAQQLQQLGLESVVIQSPFVSDRQLQQALDHPLALGLPTSPAQVESQGFRLASGLTIEKRPGLDWHQGQLDIHWAVTLPGTNTAELACAGIPFIVTLHPLAFLGGGGLSGILERLPLPTALKVSLRQKKLQRLRFTALPNQVAGQMIAPEVVLQQSWQPVVEHLWHWAQSPQECQELGQRLSATMGQAGARQRLADWVVSDEQ